MLKKSTAFFIGLLWFPLLINIAYAHEILVNTQEGETFVLNVNPQESLAEVQDKIIALSNGKKSDLLIEISARGKAKNYGMEMSHSQGGYLGYPRNYAAEVTSQEKGDIRFIVTSLANKSMIALALAKEELESAGDRIDHIHPLRFLLTVFTDEEMKAGVRNIRGKGWIWNHFVGGLKESLTTEAQIQNIKIEYVRNFAQTVKIDANIILPSIQQSNWDDFIDLLITHIPRTGDHDRYDTKRS